MSSHASFTTSLDLSVAQAWARLQDLTAAAHYVPDVVQCELHPGPDQGIGASRRVTMVKQRWLDETVTAWQEGEGFVIRLHRGERGAPPPFANAEFHYRLSASDEGKAQITTAMHYTLRGGVLGKLLDRWLLRKAMSKAVYKIGRNLKRYYETGQPSNRPQSTNAEAR
ncbi:SRPBCC family protein [Ferrimonas pelagia]|uniref:Polyketide cyclase / dehydrase and lipid transport n=1 Tax=Ferrimonas pelagia TaxID=1177826 RepID=A0ABP9ENB1_9GAMM